MNRICKTRAIAFLIVALTLVIPAFVISAAPNTTVEITLNDAVRMALQNNPALVIATADKEAAKGALTSARSGYWPTVSLSHSDSDSWSASPSSSSTGSGDRYVSDNSVAVRWTLFSGFQVQGQVTQAKLGLDSAEWGVIKAAQQLRLDATNSYFGLLQTQMFVKLNQESVDQLGQHLKDAQLQFEVGTVARTDVLRSEVELANAVQSLIKAQNANDLAMATLDNVIGLPLTTVIKPKETLSYEKVNVSLPDSITSALKLRPEIFQGTDSVKRAEAGVTVARSGYLPSVAANYRTGWNDTTFPGLASNSQSWSVSLSTSWTILDSGLTAGKVKQANEGQNKAVAQMKQTVDSVQLDVQSSYLNLREAEKRIETSGVAVGQAEEDFRIAQIRYSAGVGTNLDVLDSHVALTKAKANYVQALYDFNTSKAKLENSMGLPVNP